MHAVPQQELRSVNVFEVISLLLLFSLPFIGPGTEWALHGYQLSKGREGWREGERVLTPSTITLDSSPSNMGAPLPPLALFSKLSIKLPTERCGRALAPQSPSVRGWVWVAWLSAGPRAQPARRPPRPPHGAGPTSLRRYLQMGQGLGSHSSSQLLEEGPRGPMVPFFTGAETEAQGSPARDAQQVDMQGLDLGVL